MKRNLARSATIGGLVIGCAYVGGCSSPDEAAPPDHSASSIVRNEAAERTAAKFREDVAALDVVVSACTTPETIHDPHCPSQVLAAIRGGTSGELHTRDIFDFSALYKQIIKRMANAGKRSLCGYLSSWKGFNNVYYNRGASVTAGAARVYAAGAELVYDIGDRQMSMYTFKSNGWGNILGASVGIYGGFAFSKNRHGLFDAWSGSSWSANASYGVPETKILGITGSTFTNDEHDVIGAAAGLSVGFNFINAWGADLAVMRNEYTPWNSGTRQFAPAGASLGTSGGYDYWAFGDNDGLGPGWWLAFEMIRFEMEIADRVSKVTLTVSGPTWGAALLSIGSEYVRAETASQSIEDWCSGVASVTPDRNTTVGSCGVATATLGTRTCAAGGGGDDDGLGGGALEAELEPPEVPVSTSTDCSVDAAAACDVQFPGKNLVCSTGAQADGYCCRKPYEIKSLCYSDADCANDEVCAMATADPTTTAVFGCVKPGAQPCAKK
jgi:hypothetical protein